MTRTAPDGGYVVELTQVRRWRWEASVFRLAPGKAEPADHLLTLHGPTRRAAQRRAARFLALRQRFQPPR
jgi:hypothetical protein